MATARCSITPWLLYGSALSDGNLHLYTNLPLLLVAGERTGIKGRAAHPLAQRHADDEFASHHADKANVSTCGEAGRQHGPA